MVTVKRDANYSLRKQNAVLQIAPSIFYALVPGPSNVDIGEDEQPFFVSVFLS